MKTLSIYPKISLSTLDNLGIHYEVIESTSDDFCSIKIKKGYFEQVYSIGLEGHKKLLNGGGWIYVDKYRTKTKG